MKILGAVRRAIDRQHELEVGHGGAGARELFQSLGVGDQRPGTGILQAIRDRLVPEQDRQRQRDRAELVDGDVARRHRRSLRQQDRDPITTPDAMGRERIGEPVRVPAQRAVADLLHRAVGAHVEDGDTAGLAGGPAVAYVDTDIVVRRHLPAERAVERVVVARGRQDVRGIHRVAG